MSRENVERVVRLFENTNARDFAAVMDAYAEDVVLAVYGAPYVVGTNDGPVATGKQAVGEWFGDWFRTFDRDYYFDIEETRDWGDRVLIVATHHGRGRASGAPVVRRAAWIYTLSHGKIVRCDAYPDPATALEAAGKSE
jgi:ketosteroid isomerase-like protein